MDVKDGHGCSLSRQCLSTLHSTHCRQIVKRFWSEVGAIGPNHRAAFFVQAGALKVLCRLQRLKNRAGKQGFQIHSLAHTVIELQIQLMPSNNLDADNSQDHDNTEPYFPGALYCGTNASIAAFSFASKSGDSFRSLMS